MSDKPVVESTLRVRYVETDAMGVVHHSNYLAWFEVGRGEYMQQMGGSYAEFEEQGFYLPVSELDARFVAPARYWDVVTVRTSVAELRSRRVTFYYEVVMADSGQVLVTGHTRHICTDKQGRVRAIPKEVRALLEGKAR